MDDDKMYRLKGNIPLRINEVTPQGIKRTEYLPGKEFPEAMIPAGLLHRFEPVKATKKGKVKK